MGIIKSFVKFILDKDNQRFILLILFALTLVAAISYRDNYKEQIQETERQINNIEALSDSVRTYKDDNGELISEKLALQTDKEQLRTLNSELDDELKKVKGNVEFLNTTISRLRRDSLNVDTTIVVNIDPDIWKLTWERDEDGEGWRQYIEGYTQFRIDSSGTPQDANTEITEQTLEMSITTGVREEDGKRTIFVRSSYPYIQFTDINGAILGPVQVPEDRTPNRWGIGLQGGYGYSLGNNNLNPYIGIGVSYNFIRW